MVGCQIVLSFVAEVFDRPDRPPGINYFSGTGQSSPATTTRCSYARLPNLRATFYHRLPSHRIAWCNHRSDTMEAYLRCMHASELVISASVSCLFLVASTSSQGGLVGLIKVGLEAEVQSIRRRAERDNLPTNRTIRLWQNTALCSLSSVTHSVCW